MPPSLLQVPSTPSLLHSTYNRLSPTSNFPKSLFPPFHLESKAVKRWIFSTKTTLHQRRTYKTGIVRASLLETPVLLWAGRLCIFYALLKAGLAGSPENPFVSDLDIDSSDKSVDSGFSKWTQSILGKPAKQEATGKKLVSKWHATTKGTLRRNYRVPSKSEGQRLLRAVASLLSEDDHFIDATSHKGCQIRRESAHGESVCCNNVRALFDELPTPHLIVEITPFPAGPISETDYSKAEKLEKVLRSSPNV